MSLVFRKYFNVEAKFTQGHTYPSEKLNSR